ncbi:1-phosphofructokinase [Nevskia ramosa]|uniref:1-phosphofructokinase n=1 Tax=Nevskia ramosa TaxID=64002 RepID=UPI0003B5B0E3|nr:1-phosphofructokinase [Nevskia ramosa]
MSAPVLTVALNPALDQTITLDRLRLGEVHRARSVRIDVAGKGVNVASCLADWGVATAVTGVLGAGNATAFDALFAAKQIADGFVRRPGDTRTNVKLLDLEAADTTDINLPGLVVDGADFDAVRARLLAHSTAGSIVVLAGSLPAGLADDSYARLIAELAARGVRCVLDTSGAPLVAALDAPRDALPYAVKPNRHELEAWAGRALSTQAELIAAARELQTRGIVLVAISQGADGALFLRGDEIVQAKPLPVAVGSTVGAGDAMVAGLTAALLADASLEDLARLATAFAAAKLGCDGAHLPPREQVLALAKQVQIQRLGREADRRSKAQPFPLSPRERGGGEGLSPISQTKRSQPHGDPQ